MALMRQQKTEYMQRCDECNRVGHSMYYFELNGNTYRVCSPEHMESIQARANPKEEVTE